MLFRSMSTTLDVATRSRTAARAIRAASTDQRDAALLAIADRIDRDADAILAANAEVRALAQGGPSADEMTKVKNRVRAHFLRSLQSNFQKAQKLAEFELYWGDAAKLNEELASYLAVTDADVRRVVGANAIELFGLAAQPKPRALRWLGERGWHVPVGRRA